MGGQLVRRAHVGAFYQLHGGRPLTSNEMLVLLYMCSVAMDNDDPPRFWQGRDVLAEHALSRRVPENAGKRRSLYESVRKALAGLADRDAIRRVGGGYPGRAAEYELHVDNLLPASIRDNVTLGHPQSEEGPLTTSGWKLAHPRVGPETQLNPDLQENPNHQSRPSHLRPVENGGTKDVA